MLGRRIWVLGSCAVAGILVGFFALAMAAADEPVLPAGLVAIFSPGLRLAEVVMPERHESLGWTFGWFLRIALATNALFYFVVFALLAYAVEWLLWKPKNR
jgi:hypothetical protein